MLDLFDNITTLNNHISNIEDWQEDVNNSIVFTALEKEFMLRTSSIAIHSSNYWHAVENNPNHAWRYNQNCVESAMKNNTKLGVKNRNELLNALESRNDETLIPLLKFIIKNIRDSRFTSNLIELTENILNIYTPIFGKSEQVDKYFRILRKLIIEEINLQKDLMSLKGSIDTLMLASSLKK